MLLGRHKVNYASMTMIICDGLWEQHRLGARRTLSTLCQLSVESAMHDRHVLSPAGMICVWK